MLSNHTIPTKDHPYRPHIDISPPLLSKFSQFHIIDKNRISARNIQVNDRDTKLIRIFYIHPPDR